MKLQHWVVLGGIAATSMLSLSSLSHWPPTPQEVLGILGQAIMSAIALNVQKPRDPDATTRASDKRRG